jgi:hypothetical protein
VLFNCFYVLLSGSPMWCWDCVGLKTLKRRKKASGLKREISERSDPLETSSFFLMKKGVSYVVTR